MNAVTDLDPGALVRVSVTRRDAHTTMQGEDDLAAEVPVALEYNGISHAVMLSSPQDLEDFALGFSLSEGILAHAEELFECEVVEEHEGYTVQMRISAERFAGMKERRRSLAGRTGCGLCGTETLASAIRRPAAVATKARFSTTQVREGMRTMKSLQRMKQCTGATHAAAWMDATGTIVLVREDVGRHNALDKLIGAMMKKKQDVSCGAALITSRASYEMVQKCATAGIGLLAAISAPTSLAVSLAEATNVTLMGFVRERGHVVYTVAEGVLEEV